MRDMLLESQPVPVQPKTYKVGDYYNENGKEGVVFAVDATGRHGKIVGMKYSKEKLQWCTYEQCDKNVSTGATNLFDGMRNQHAIERIAGWREKYPAFAWCAAQGEGWYLPAIEELKTLLLNDAVYNVVNRILIRHWGVKLPDKNATGPWSSSEKDRSIAWYLFMYGGDSNSAYGNCFHYVRAVSAF